MKQHSQDIIWDHWQNHIADDRFFADARYHHAIKHIRPQSHVLNIGVGKGGLEALLLQQGGYQVTSLDPSPTSIARLQQQYGDRIRAVTGYSQEMPFPDQSFDAVVMLEVLEHLTDEAISATLHHVSRVLRPQGRFICSVPNDEDLAASLIVCPHCQSTFHRWGHVQRFTRERLHGMLLQRFQRVIVRHTYWYHRSAFQSLNWKGKLMLHVRQALLLMGSVGHGASLLAIADAPIRA